jgi:uncharacterized protein (TIGR03437 family)
MVLGNTPLAAQTLPGNSTIQGSYYFRQMGVDTSTANNEVISASGTMTFDGNGNYSISATRLNPDGTTTSLTTPGTYTVLSNGTFTITPGVDIGNGGVADSIFGGVGTTGSNHILVGSSTDSYGPTLDLFVAVPVASNNASNATLNGNYVVASMEFRGGNTDSSVNTFFSVTADGSGNLGNASITGTVATVGTTSTTQTATGATYSVGTAGNGTITFPAPSGVAAASQLLSGAKTLYVSPDGSFFIAGGASSYDFVVGVKALSGTNNTMPLSGLYFTGIVENDLTTGGLGLYSSQGVANEVSGTEVAYERATDPVDYSYDDTYSDSFVFEGNGTVLYTDTSGNIFYQYAAGAGGNMVVSAGASGLFYLNVYVKSIPVTGSGVFLNPQGIVNAASSAPFEAAIAPGEFIALYGSNLANQTAQATSLPFPATLGNVQVTLNGTAIPLYYVSPGFIEGIVPYTSNSDNNLDMALQVINNGTKSNIAQWYSGYSNPGIFTISENGEGDGSIIDAATYAVINSSNPAKIGEQVALFMTGLGTVNASVAAGAAGPDNATAVLNISLGGVFVDGVQATVNYQGLAPGLAGLYQVNITLPTGITTGQSDDIGIETVDQYGNVVSYNDQATIPISN